MDQIPTRTRAYRVICRISGHKGGRKQRRLAGSRDSRTPVCYLSIREENRTRDTGKRAESLMLRRVRDRETVEYVVCVSTISADDDDDDDEGENAATSHLKKITVRGHFARMENRCVTATLEQPCSLHAKGTEREGERERGRGIEGARWGEKERDRSPETKIPVADDVTGPLYIHAPLIFTLLKDLSATRSAVIPAAPEYRGSIKRRRRNCVPPAILPGVSRVSATVRNVQSEWKIIFLPNIVTRLRYSEQPNCTKFRTTIHFICSSKMTSKMTLQFVLFEDDFISRSGWRTEDAFFSKNCRNSNRV